MKLKIAFCTNVFNDSEMEASLRALKRIGYDGVEFWDSYLRSVDTRWLKSLVDDIGLEVLQLCPYFVVTASRQELLDSYETARQYVEWGHLFECNHIRTFTGDVSSAEASEELFEQGIEGLREICRIGLDAGMLFVLETHYHCLMDTTPAIQRLLRSVNMPNLKLNLQLPLDYEQEDVYQSVETHAKDVVHMHLHNWIDKWLDFTYLDNGKLDIRRIVNILHRRGFNGVLSVEHATHSGVTPLEIAERDFRFLSGVRAEL